MFYTKDKNDLNFNIIKNFFMRILRCAMLLLVTKRCIKTASLADRLANFYAAFKVPEGAYFSLLLFILIKLYLGQGSS